MEHIAEQVNTTLLEVYHSKKICYLPKSTFFSMEKMLAGTQVAALQHNHNLNRPQKYNIGEEGVSIPLFRIANSKPNIRHITNIVKEEQGYLYVFEIFILTVGKTHCLKKDVRDQQCKISESLLIKEPLLIAIQQYSSISSWEKTWSLMRTSMQCANYLTKQMMKNFPA